MLSIIKQFERLLSCSTVYFPDPSQNVAASFKVILPEIYYDTFRELNDRQKEIVAKFVTLFCKKMYELEKYNNDILNNGTLNFEKDKNTLLNRQNIMSFFIERFGNCLNPYTDIRIRETEIYYAKVKNNTMGKARWPIILGTEHGVKGLKTVVMLKISSQYFKKIVDFLQEFKLGAGCIDVGNSIFDMYFQVDIFDGEIVFFKNIYEEEIEKFYSEGARI